MSLNNLTVTTLRSTPKAAPAKSTRGRPPSPLLQKLRKIKVRGSVAVKVTPATKRPLQAAIGGVINHENRRRKASGLPRLSQTTRIPGTILIYPNKG